VSCPVALVTGASRGIGRHLADALEAAGYAVERGSRSVADVTDRAAVERWVAQVTDRHGRVDVLVNNAGVVDAEVSLADSDPDDWWRTVEVDLRGPYLLTRAVLPHMLAAGSGRIVNLSSGAAYRTGDSATAYNVAKGALSRLTAATGLHAERGVLAFDLAPGVVRTDMTEGMVAHRGRTQWTDPAVVAELLLALVGGELDAWNGRLVRAGVDTVDSLRERAARGLAGGDRTLTVQRWGADDPLP
jgi:NAD(P)-dependent dehydrogenase (short-subunit alcohol dehydrogenase family)